MASRTSSVQSFASAEDMSSSFTPPSPDGDLSNHSSNTSQTSGHVCKSARFYLPDGNLELQLDDGTTYRVHRHFFDAHSPTFAAAYLDDTHATTIHLPDVSSVDLDRFLSLIYPSALGERDIEAVDEWTSVLRLATKWSIPSLRALAIREIEPKATAIDKVVIAREFDLGSSWLAPAISAICASPRWLEYSEAERLGLRSVVEIGRIREEQRSACVAGCPYDVAAAVFASPVLVPSPLVPPLPVVETVVQEEVASGALQVPDPETADDVTVEAQTSAHSEVAAKPPDDRVDPKLDSCTSDEPLERALFALKLHERSIDNESPATYRRREASMYRIIDDLITETIIPEGSEAFSYTFNKHVKSSLALRIVQRRLAGLIARQILQRPAQRMEDTSSSLQSPVQLLTVLLRCKSGLALRSAIAEGLELKGLNAWIPADQEDPIELDIPIPSRSDACNLTS
ncbi:hypothetical protein BD626DRAFT_2927 [Schizophyllum amplum]|uniref:BTB domain-containing protein n=1 Tax=Schizophyllum amplum TaxID=97359 RepID=A0A550CVV5_9AGAR|nr:hypothetical protein BD626DRAFT_2927 [Auriculariopsis ampla]